MLKLTGYTLKKNKFKILEVFALK